MNQVFLQADNLLNSILFSKEWLVRLDLKKLLIRYDLSFVSENLYKCFTYAVCFIKIESVLKFLPKTYQYIHLESLLLGILMCLILLLPRTAFAQPKSVSNKDAYYDQIEERARSLSAKLAAFTNSEIDNENTYLNSDIDFNSSFVKTEDENESTSFSGTSDTASVELETEVKLEDEVELVTMESHVGKYYIQPFIGFSIPPHHVKFKGLSHSAEIRTEIGHAVGINIGRRWMNFDAELHYGYVNTEFKKAVFPFPYSSPRHASGQSELFNGGARLGYGLPFGEGGWFRLAAGVGFANRKDILNLDQLGTITTYLGSETIFTYDFLFSLGYEVKKDLDAFVAYRVLGMVSKGDFDESAMHLLQLGLGANF